MLLRRRIQVSDFFYLFIFYVAEMQFIKPKSKYLSEKIFFTCLYVGGTEVIYFYIKESCIFGDTLKRISRLLEFASLSTSRT